LEILSLGKNSFNSFSGICIIKHPAPNRSLLKQSNAPYGFVCPPSPSPKSTLKPFSLGEHFIFNTKSEINFFSHPNISTFISG